MSDRPSEKLTSQEVNEQERYEALKNLEEWLEGPVRVLGLVWLVLLLIEFIWGLNPFLEALVYVIWGIFILDFAIRFFLATKKISFLRTNWLTVISLALPALRIFTIFRAFRAIRFIRTLRGVPLVRLVSSINRGMRALRTFMGRRKFGYVLALTLLVTLAGSAGMLAFEGSAETAGGLNSFSEALWFTAMIMTTLGSDYWPSTAEGRTLTFLLAVYSFSVFGYVTAALATYFIGREAATPESEVASKETIQALRSQISELQETMRILRQDLSTGPDGEKRG